jgi:hypothetical protein
MGRRRVVGSPEPTYEKRAEPSKTLTGDAAPRDVSSPADILPPRNRKPRAIGRRKANGTHVVGRAAERKRDEGQIERESWRQVHSVAAALRDEGLEVFDFGPSPFLALCHVRGAPKTPPLELPSDSAHFVRVSLCHVRGAPKTPPLELPSDSAHFVRVSLREVSRRSRHPSDPPRGWRGSPECHRSREDTGRGTRFFACVPGRTRRGIRARARRDGP